MGWGEGSPTDKDDSMSYPHCFQSHFALAFGPPSASALEGCITGLLSVYMT